MNNPFHASQQLTLSLPTGPLGLGIQQNDNGHCVVAGRNPTINSPLLENDVILSMNGIQLIDVEGGVDAWVKIFSSFSDMPRQVVVSRSAAVAAKAVNVAPAPRAVPASSAPAPIRNRPLVTGSWACNGNYRRGIIEAITELKDRMGTSSYKIKEHMQANMPPNRKWMNGTYLNALKHAVSDNDIVQVKGKYKITSSYMNKKKNAQKFEATKKRATEMKKKQDEKKRIAAAKAKEREIRLKQAEGEKQREMDPKILELRKILENEMKLQANLLKKEIISPRESVPHASHSKAGGQQQGNPTDPTLSTSTNGISDELAAIRRQNMADMEMIEVYRTHIYEVLKHRKGRKGSRATIKNGVEAAMGEGFAGSAVTAALSKMSRNGEVAKDGETYTLARTKLRAKASSPKQAKMQDMVVNEKVYRVGIIAVLKQRSGNFHGIMKNDMQAAMGKTFSNHAFNAALRKMANDGEVVQDVATYTLSSKLLGNRQLDPSKKPQMTIQTNNLPPPASLPRVSLSPVADAASTSEARGAKSFGGHVDTAKKASDIANSTHGSDSLPGYTRRPSFGTITNATHCTLVSSNVHTLDMSSIKRTKVTVTINKPTIGSKLGIGIQTIAGGPIEVHYMAPDSVFASSDLTVGMTLDSVNGIKCNTCGEAVGLMKETVGQMTLVAIREEESTTAM